VLEADEHIYSRSIDGLRVFFRAGAVVVPSSEKALIESLLVRAHYRVTSHAAAHAMTQYLNYVYWVGMAADVKQFARSCVPCQLAKAPRSLPASAFLLRMAMQPFSELQMDVLVFPARVARLTGRVGIFAITDDFTGWVWLETLVDQSAATLSQALASRVFRDFPLPSRIASDGHPSFVSDEMSALLGRHGVEHRVSAPYNAREHGGVERKVRVTFERLRAIFRGDTDGAVIEIERAMRNTPSPAHLNLSPYEAAYGVRGEPSDRLWDPEAIGDLESQLAARKQAVEDMQRSMLRCRLDRQYRRELATGPTPTFSIGDTVMLLRPRRTR